MPKVVQRQNRKSSSTGIESEQPWLDKDHQPSRIVQLACREQITVPVAAKRLKASAVELSQAQTIKRMYDEHTAGRISMEINSNRSMRWGGR